MGFFDDLFGSDKTGHTTQEADVWGNSYEQHYDE